MKLTIRIFMRRLTSGYYEPLDIIKSVPDAIVLLNTPTIVIYHGQRFLATVLQTKFTSTWGKLLSWGTIISRKLYWSLYFLTNNVALFCYNSFHSSSMHFIISRYFRIFVYFFNKLFNIFLISLQYIFILLFHDLIKNFWDTF